MCVFSHGWRHTLSTHTHLTQEFTVSQDERMQLHFLSHFLPLALSHQFGGFPSSLQQILRRQPQIRAYTHTHTHKQSNTVENEQTAHSHCITAMKHLLFSHHVLMDLQHLYKWFSNGCVSVKILQWILHQIVMQYSIFFFFFFTLNSS